MANPNLVGNLAAFYWQVKGDGYQTGSDTGTPDEATILADESWSDLCLVDLTYSKARTLNQVVDRCSGDQAEYTAGRMDWTVTANLNTFRIADVDIVAWNNLADVGQIVPLLILDSERDDPEVRGYVGNFLIETDATTQPSEGQITQAITFRPAAIPIADSSNYKIRAVYGLTAKVNP